MLSRVEPERPVNPLFPRTRQMNPLHKRYAKVSKIIKNVRRVTLTDLLRFQNVQKDNLLNIRCKTCLIINNNNQNHEMKICKKQTN